MSDVLSHGLTVLTGFFAIMNPIANAPVFLGLTEGDDATTRKQVAARALGIAFIIILVFCIAGRFIFDIFGISLPAFRITGGLLIFMIGFHMLQGDHSPVQSPLGADGKPDREAALGVAVSPLALPILAGPGTIATAMNFVADTSFSNAMITVGSFGLLCFISYWVFVSAERIVSILGKNAMAMVTRIMGLILAVIGTQMVIDGVSQVLPLVSGSG